MTLTPQITFRNMETAPDLEAAVLKEAMGLARFFNRIMSCHVVIDGPRRQEPGGLYGVRIDLGVPGGNLVADQSPTHDARLAIHDAFQQIRRQLQDYARRRRGDVKQHEEPLSGPEGRLAGRTS